MARPKKPENQRQTEKIVVYVTPDMKNEVMKTAGEFGLSESQLGEQAIRRYLQVLKGERHTVEYVQEETEVMLTGPLNGTDILKQLDGLDDE